MATETWLLSATALSAVVLIGNLIARRWHGAAARAAGDAALFAELERAQAVAHDLGNIAARIDAETAIQMADVAAFQDGLERMLKHAGDANWHDLRNQADALIGPTLKLTTTLSLACDELREQMSRLTTFAAARIDPATGLRNRRSMEEHLDALLSASVDGRRRLALGLFSISAVDETDGGDLHLAAVGQLMEQCVRGNDVAARYSRDEFVVLMPKTTLAGGLAFGERLVRLVDAELGRHVWGGVVEAAVGETPQKLLSRADSALYTARTHDEACLCQHNGQAVRRHVMQMTPPALCLVAEAGEVLIGGSP